MYGPALKKRKNNLVPHERKHCASRDPENALGDTLGAQVVGDVRPSRHHATMTASETALAAEGLEMGEVKVGAVVVKPRHAQTVKDALNEHMWHKGKVTPYTVDDGSKVGTDWV